MQEKVSIVVVRYEQKFPSLGSRFGITRRSLVMPNRGPRDGNFRYISHLWKLLEPPHDKTNKMTMRTAKTQISLGIRPVWSQSSLCAQWVAKNPSFLHADSEDSDQTGRMPRLIWVFAGRTLILLVLSCRGSLIYLSEATLADAGLYTCSLVAVEGDLLSEKLVRVIVLPGKLA